MYYKGPIKPYVANVETIPFYEISEYYGSIFKSGLDTSALLNEFITKFCTQHAIKSKASWVFPQLLAKFSQLPLKRNDSGKYSAAELFKDIRKDEWLSGALLLVRNDVKSCYLRSQTDADVRNFGTLVPFILSAYKKMHNVMYGEWDESELHLIVHKSLVDAMRVKELPEITVDEIIADRNAALTNKSTGVMSNPSTTYSIYITKESKMYQLPKLARIMMCQTWLAHPNNRTEYMILNPLDWDNIPEKLLNTEVFRKQVYTSDSEW